MSLVISSGVVLSRIQQYPAVLGEPWGGGYFAGYISHTADGNPTHALIVAPRETGATGTGYTLTTNLAWKTTNTTTAGATSTFDGAANTAAIVAAGIADHPAAQFCVNLSIGGFTDWYLPARDEIDIAYFNLKPSTLVNSIGSEFGVNFYAVPKRSTEWTANYPAITNVSLFSGGAESFPTSGNPFHWTSTEPSVAGGTRYRSSEGYRDATGKTTLYAVRAFRRIALP